MASPHSGRDTLQLVSASGTNHGQVTMSMVETHRLAVVTVVESPCSRLVSAATGTSGKSQRVIETPCSWSGCSGDEWQVTVVETPCSWSVQRGRDKSQATVAKTSCKEEPASPSVPPSWPSPQVYQRDQVPGSHTTLMDYLRWDSHITNTTSKASKTRVLGEEPEGGLHDHQGASIQSPG